jgi:hypothetical protein
MIQLRRVFQDLKPALAGASLAFLIAALCPMIANASPPLFPTEQEAQAHCPRDVVVWLNLPTGIYHYKGRRWYGNTKRGGYVCEQEAKQSGDRAALNGE